MPIDLGGPTRVPGNLSHVHDLAARGFHVFPLVPGSKRPLVSDWEHRATTDPDLIAAWPTGAGVGIACGPSGLVVLDLDAHGGERPAQWAKAGINDGLDVFADIWAEHDDRSFWETMTVWTPSGGVHVYFRAPEGRDVRNSAGRVGWQVDVRAQGGYVVGPGTVTEAGTYETVYAPGELMELPQWLSTLLVDHRPGERLTPPRQLHTAGNAGRRVEGILRTVAEAPGGKRNDTLNWAGWTLRDEGLLNGDMLERLGRAAQAAGLPAAEIRATLASVLRSTGKAAA